MLPEKPGIYLVTLRNIEPISVNANRPYLKLLA